MTAPPVAPDLTARPPGTALRRPSVPLVTSLFAAELLLTLLIQFPAVANFDKFAFFDQGASLRLDQLFAAGRKPTVDLGYSYGMLPLLLGRAWFAALGRTPAAYIAFVTVCNLIGAWAVARFLAAIQSDAGKGGIPWSHVAVAALVLPFAIMPDNYSFMHPLEMALFLLALAQQARGRHGSALAFATAALLTKPSMAYVLGFLLLCFAFYRRARPKFLLPAVAVFVGGVAVFWFAVGPHAAFANILPLTGGNSYRLMNFGFFRAGRNFWLHSSPTLADGVAYYLFTPVTFWIAATLCLFALAVPALSRLGRKNAALPTDPVLVTLAVLHAAFIFVFYAWDRSWTYYSYLPVLGLLVGLPALLRKKWILVPILALALLAHTERVGYGWGAWQWWHRSPETANLWTYSQLQDEWRTVRQITRDAGGDKTLFLVNGAASILFPGIQTPESWFLSPGIPTEAELARVKSQIDHADLIVLYKNYDQAQEAWNWPDLSTQRAPFDRTPPLWQGNYFTILRRTPAR